MRLINVKTRKFEEFIGQDIPEYAILSHTWGEEEVSFADYNKEDEEYKKKLGYIKIDYTCRQAELDGIPYCWVDTCNIDKSSSAELQEAINSMFRWYENAVVCYVYLSDVLHGSFRQGFISSRWFTRGWTLQELIAPCTVRFYDTNWIYCGTRADFEGEISEITGIEPIYLQHRRFEDAPIAIRMSWAARRTTTRLEDEAYCMLGLFNIFMPLIYGEGKMAFFRLQQEIVKVNPDQSIYAWGLPEDPSFTWSGKFSDNFQTSRLFAESTTEFRHSGSLVPVFPATVDAAKTTSAQTITLELPIITMRVKQFCIGILPLRTRAYPYHSVGMMLQTKNRRYRRVHWYLGEANGCTFTVPTLYALQSHRKEITLFTQDFPEAMYRGKITGTLNNRLFFMSGLQHNAAELLQPLEFRIVESSYDSNGQDNTSCLHFERPADDEYAIIQLNLDKFKGEFCSIGIRLTHHTLAIKQVESHDTCSTLRSNTFYEAALFHVQDTMYVAKVISMRALTTFVVQVHRVELDKFGRVATVNDEFPWYTRSIKTMIIEGHLGTRLDIDERSTELE